MQNEFTAGAAYTPSFLTRALLLSPCQKWAAGVRQLERIKDGSMTLAGSIPTTATRRNLLCLLELVRFQHCGRKLNWCQDLSTDLMCDNAQKPTNSVY